MKAALQNHHARMQRVLDHIDRHLDDDLDLDALSSVAAYSKYHFHRQFTATFGLSVHRYIQLARMKRASYRLAYRDAPSVTDITAREINDNVFVISVLLSSIGIVVHPPEFRRLSTALTLPFAPISAIPYPLIYRYLWESTLVQSRKMAASLGEQRNCQGHDVQISRGPYQPAGRALPYAVS